MRAHKDNILYKQLSTATIIFAFNSRTHHLCWLAVFQHEIQTGDTKFPLTWLQWNKENNFALIMAEEHWMVDGGWRCVMCVLIFLFSRIGCGSGVRQPTTTANAQCNARQRKHHNCNRMQKSLLTTEQVLCRNFNLNFEIMLANCSWIVAPEGVKKGG